MKRKAKVEKEEEVPQKIAKNTLNCSICGLEHHMNEDDIIDLMFDPTKMFWDGKMWISICFCRDIKN